MSSMSAGTSAEDAKNQAAAPGGPQGLPRRTRPRAAPSAPPARDVATDGPQDDDAQDSLSPDALARAMTAIQRGSMRARLAEPDGAD